MSRWQALGTHARAIADRALEHPIAYRSIQAPFAEAKLAPFFEQIDRSKLESVLDVGCGPGTNAAHFRDVDYTGIDINPDYIASARRRFGERFVVGDVTDPTVLPGTTFDCVLMNSLLHHLDDDAAHTLLSRLAARVAPGGRIHILDLVLPERMSAARVLARLDRGRHARRFEHWRTLFTTTFQQHSLTQYPLGVPGLPLWQMVYFIGSPR